MKRAVSTVSAPVEAQLEATVKTHIVVKNIRGIIDDAKSGNFDQEIVRVESKPMPMQTIHYKGSHQHQMMKFGVEISKIEGLHHCTIYSVNPWGNFISLEAQPRKLESQHFWKYTRNLIK